MLNGSRIRSHSPLFFALLCAVGLGVALSGSAVSAQPKTKKERTKGPVLLTVDSTPKALVFVDGRSTGKTTPLEEYEVKPGSHRIQVKWPDGQMSTVKRMQRRFGHSSYLFERDMTPKGWLVVMTPYKASVMVDDQPYPRRNENGLVVNANERHKVHVQIGDKEKTYTVVVGPRERRTLVVDISGFNTPPTPTAAPKTTTKKPAAKEEDKDESGKLTVYSKPKGEVYVDGSAVGATTPMINRELELGRHEVQVKWETGEMSEVKTVRIRKGSKLKLFFRDRKKK